MTRVWSLGCGSSRRGAAGDERTVGRGGGRGGQISSLSPFSDHAVRVTYESKQYRMIQKEYHSTPPVKCPAPLWGGLSFTFVKRKCAWCPCA